MREGGRLARRGFRYQDLCALRYCIAAAHDGPWTEVLHEYGDDVVLWANTAEGSRVRYVQVKHEEDARQHWTCSRLTRSESTRGTVADSVLGKLFAKDEGLPNTDFRLAVNEGVDDDLQPLHYRWGNEEPEVSLSCSGAQKLLQAFQTWSPLEGRTIDDYIGAFLLEQHSNEIADMDARLHAELALVLKSHGHRLLDDELADVLDSLYLIVYRAASDDERSPGSPEKIVVDDFLSRALGEATSRRQRTESAAADQQQTLGALLSDAGFDADDVARARNLRRLYYRRWMAVRGTRDGEGLEAALMEVQAIVADTAIEGLDADGHGAEPLVPRALQKVHIAHGEMNLGPNGVTIELMEGMLYFVLSRGAGS